MIFHPDYNRIKHFSFGVKASKDFHTCSTGFAEDESLNNEFDRHQVTPQKKEVSIKIGAEKNQIRWKDSN